MTNVDQSVRTNTTDIMEKNVHLVKDYLRSEEIDHLTLVACDLRNRRSWVLLSLYLQQVLNAGFYVNSRRYTAYSRVNCSAYWVVYVDTLQGRTRPGSSVDVLVLEDEHFDLVDRAIEDDLSRDTMISLK
jgi:hypothetical protein